jgi:hypothetical protein
MDIGRVPGTNPYFPYFILHSTSGLHLVDIKNRRMYTLYPSKQEVANVCRSICLMQMDSEDPTQGFWLAQIDNEDINQTKILCYDFGPEFIQNLDKQAEQL